MSESPGSLFRRGVAKRWEAHYTGCRRCKKVTNPERDGKKLCAVGRQLYNAERDLQVHDAVVEFDDEMKDAKIVGIPVTPLAGVFALFGATLLKDDVPGKKRLEIAGTGLLGRHLVRHVSEQRPVLEGFPKRDLVERPERPGFFEVLFKSENPKEPIPKTEAIEEEGTLPSPNSD